MDRRKASRKSKKPLKKKAIQFSLISAWVNILLAPKEFVNGIEQWFARFNINKDIYDSAIDSVYNATRVGGAKLHHIVDGQHTIWGAFKAVRDASPNDKFFQEVANTTEHLVRDMCSKSGISPLLHLTKEQYEKFASFTNIPSNWLADALTFNPPELIGASMATLPLIHGWNKYDSKRFSEFVGMLFVPVIVGAKPLLGLVVLIAASRAFMMWKKENCLENNKLQLAKSALKGSVTPGTFYLVSFIIPGPQYIGLILGIVVAELVRRKKMNDKEWVRGLKRFLRAFYLDFLKPKTRLIEAAIKDACKKSSKKLQNIDYSKIGCVLRSKPKQLAVAYAKSRIKDRKYILKTFF
jgi:hypothetical protein